MKHPCLALVLALLACRSPAPPPPQSAAAAPTPAPAHPGPHIHASLLGLRAGGESVPDFQVEVEFVNRGTAAAEVVEYTLRWPDPSRPGGAATHTLRPDGLVVDAGARVTRTARVAERPMPNAASDVAVTVVTRERGATSITAAP